MFQWRQINYIHYLPLFVEFIGLTIPEYRSVAIFSIVLHVASCTVLTMVTTWVWVRVQWNTLKNVVTESSTSETEK